MDDVKLKKEDLLEALGKNKETHKSTVRLAQAEYKRQQVERLERALEKARKGEDTAGERMELLRMPVPEDHTHDYDVAIQMLERDVRKVFKIDQTDFRRYFNDEWEWQRSFFANTGSYAVAAASR